MKGSFTPLFVTNFLGVANDNFLKTLAGFVVIGWVADAAMRPVYMGLTAGALVLPYVFFSPLADRLTVLLPKCRILVLAKWAELPIMGVAVAGFVLHSAALVVASVLLMGLQSALYSPAKYALVRDIGGTDRISTGMGGMEGVSFLAMLVGTVLASVAVDAFSSAARFAALFGFAALGLLSSHMVTAQEEPNRFVHSVNPIRYLRRAYRMAGRYPGLNAVIVLLSVFWWAAAILQMGLLVYGREVMGLDATHTGIMLCAAAVGIVAGQVLAGFVDRRRSLMGGIVLTGWLAAAILFVLACVPMGMVWFSALLFLLALDLGFFKLPLDAEIQKTVKGPKLNAMLSYFNQMSFLFMLAGSGCYAVASSVCGPGAFLYLLAIMMAVAPLVFLLFNRRALVSFGRWALGRRYAVEFAVDRPIDGSLPLLVLPNHPAMVDPMLVLAAFRSVPLRPLVDERFFRAGFLPARILRTLAAVPVPDLRVRCSARDARLVRGLNDVVLNALRNGGSVIFYPSGHIQAECDREVIATRQLAHNVCRDLPDGTRVLLVRTTGLWGSIWSRKGRRNAPNFMLTFVKALLLWLFAVPFMPRRRIRMEVADLTNEARVWSRLSRLEFNARLEMWYNKV